ncbi:MAG: glycine cleavage system protein GcvH [Planctomycetota bacterium]|nr:glycine cleavage system protein GcvH [Planctomycetota bacterium]
MSDRPTELKYSTTHEWVRIEGDEATVGITDFAVEHLGDLVFVDLPDVGASIDVDETGAEVESVKAVGEVHSPVGGEVTAVNEGLADDQGPLASDPFGEGWLYKLKVSDVSDALMDLDAYETQLESESV